MTRRIRIIEAALGLSVEEHLGGAELFTINLATALDPARFDVTVCGLWEFGSSGEQMWKAHLQQHHINAHLLVPHTGHLGVDMRAAVRPFHQLLKDTKPDIVNTHAEFMDMLAPFVRITRRHSFNHIRTLHLNQEFEVIRRFHPRVAPLIAFTYPFFCRHDVGVSRSSVEMLNQRPLARLFNRKAHLFFNSIRQSELFARLAGHDIRAELGMQPESLLVGIVGRLTEQKGHDLFLHIAKHMCEKKLDARFVIVGAGPREEELKRMAHDMQLDEQVLFLGSRRDAPDIIRSLSVILSTSQWEGFPTVIVEAMLLGTPVVASDIDGSNELVQLMHTGVTIPLTAPVSTWTNAIMMLSQQPALARSLVANAREHVKQFAMEQTIAQYEELYENITTSKRYTLR